MYRRDKNGEFVKIKHNWKLHENRDKKRYSNSICTYRIKPTSHKQHCQVCKQEFKKGYVLKT